ncbi:MAG: phosphomethylpyrimidine synthase ThiC, partial [Acidobacteria bacterium]|nr:phosphomethylpyrimidine synthase ThiC [Acidobacteriota bacterium]
MSTLKETLKEAGEKLSVEVELPNSRKIYVEGSQTGVRVPLREISQHATRNYDASVEENPPVRVYD